MGRVLSAIFAMCCVGSPALAITIPTVLVGDAGNAPDPLTGLGSVEYEYRIGTYEVTLGQYTAFLNAVATSDPYGLALYNSDLGTDPNVAGIAISGGPGNYSYSVIGSPSRPVTYVSWGAAARFVNWLHNGQPIGAPGPGTTEAGAYTLNGTGDFSNVTRNAGATWFLPSENEWYKAAYYQPAENGGDIDNYWLYPTVTNNPPYAAPPPGTSAPDPSNTANIPGSLTIGPNRLTDVGAYNLASSFYGTFDQAGNVWEWNDTAFFDGAGRGVRGGSWWFLSNVTESPSSTWNVPSTPLLGFQVPDYGFRVAAVVSVPEPSALMMTAIGVAALAGYRRRRKT